NIADLLPHGIQHQLAFVLPSSADPHALNHPAAHSGHKQVSFPFWKPVAGVEQNVRDPNRRDPKEPWRLHAFAKRLFADDLARVFASIADDRPAIICAWLEDVHLVSTHRSMFAGPDLARFGINRHSLRVAVSVGIDLRLSARPPDKRIVGRDSAIVIESDNLSIMVAQVLCQRFGGRAAIPD